MGVLDEMLDGVPEPAPPEKSTWEKFKTGISNIPSDISTSLGDYATGARQGLQELNRQGDNLAITNPLALSGTPMGDNVTNAPAPEQTTEQKQAADQYQDASNQFIEGTIKPPLLPAAIAGNTVAGILYAPFMAKDAYDSYNAGGGGIEGAKTVARDFTYGGAVDFANQPDLAQKFEDRPVQNTVNGILSIAPAFLLGRSAYKAGKATIDKPSILKDMGVDPTILTDVAGEQVPPTAAEIMAKDIPAPKAIVETAPDIKGNDIIAAGEKQLGKPYELGSDGSNATDCGLFTQQTLAENGIKLDYRTADGQYLQMEKEGKIFASESEAQVGDLVFFDVPSNRSRWSASNDPSAVNSSGEAYKGVTHVGIYAGEGKVLQAGSHGVSYADINAFGDIVGFAKTGGEERSIGKTMTRENPITEENTYNESVKQAAEESVMNFSEKDTAILSEIEKTISDNEKQPWQMTKGEFDSAIKSTDTLAESIPKDNIYHEQFIEKALSENLSLIHI